MLTYVDRHLHIEDVSVADVARVVRTPFYLYSLDELTRRVLRLRRAFPKALIAYAYKANATPALLAHLTAQGCGADVVSLNELRAALAAGVPPDHIVVNGNAKGDDFLRLAICVGVRTINLDAREEIPRVARLAEAEGRDVNVSLRINPGLDVHTHPHLQVGARGSHFGIPPDDVLHAAADVAETRLLHLQGIHIHAGSQLLDDKELEQIAEVASGWVTQLRAAGHDIRSLDLGGGFGIDYTGDQEITPERVARRWDAHLASLNVNLILEPGRWVIARAGILVVRVVQVKHAWGRTFVAVDGGMNALLRPALYGARHRIWPVVRRGEERPVDVVGPNCESADVLGRDVLLPPVTPGDLLVILDTGAYGYSLANRYNLRPWPPQVVVEGTAWRVLPD